MAERRLNADLDGVRDKGSHTEPRLSADDRVRAENSPRHHRDLENDRASADLDGARMLKFDQSLVASASLKPGSPQDRPRTHGSSARQRRSRMDAGVRPYRNAVVNPHSAGVDPRARVNTCSQMNRRSKIVCEELRAPGEQIV